MSKIKIAFFIFFVACFSEVSNAEVIGHLPEPIANNAVAAAKTSQGWQLFI